MVMESDLEGRVKNTKVPFNSGLGTLFEAIVNSIQAMPNPKEGNITIKASTTNISGLDGSKGTTIVDGFIIKDDGVGFNDDNYKSFCMLDSQYKSKLGCKGIGRLSWLKVFNDVSVESVFEKDGKRFKRSFKFSIANDISGGEDLIETNSSIGTVVKLLKCKSEYQKSIPVTAKTISDRIFNHCLSFFITDKAPKIKIELNDEIEFVSDLMESAMKNVDSESINILNYSFELKHIQFYKATNDKSGLSLCANGLEVIHSNDISIVPMNENGIIFRYRCYVSSLLFDDTVSNSRDSFDLGTEGRTIDNHEVPCIPEIKRKIIEKCNCYLEQYSENYLGKCKQRMEEFNNTELGKPFSAAIKYDPELISKITPEMTPKEMFGAYSESQSKVESSVIFRPDTRKKRKIDDSSVIESELEKVNLIQKDQLTRTILHRNIILKTYRNRLDAINDECKGDNDKFVYEQEKLIHDILLPRGTDKRNRPIYETCNLWMIDERLHYYAFLRAPLSDKGLKNKVDHPDGDLRPDIMIYGDFDKDECAKSIAIVELKRPNREDKSIIDQIFDYVEIINSGDAFDYSGQPIKVHPGLTTYFCYAICNVYSKGFESVMLRNGFKPQFGGNSYFSWNDGYRASIEVIDHTALASIANERNAIFFKAIGVEIDKDDITVTKGETVRIGLRDDGEEQDR